MKIAILGKGGSGKSTVSWLLVNHFSVNNPKNKVLAIDADHNMDLMANLGVDMTNKLPVFYKANEEIRTLAGMSQNGRWGVYLDLEPLTLSYNPSSNIIEKYLTPVAKNIDLMTMGLGEDDIMYADKCAHGLSGHFKYILPTLAVKPKDLLLIDSVAGADMLNYGLYYGTDIVCVVVEGHKNSIKVATQLKEIADKQGINLKFILNKYNSENPLIIEFQKKFNESVLGFLPNDTGVLELDYAKVSSEMKNALTDLSKKINLEAIIPDKAKHANLKKFELEKRKLNPQ